MQIPHSNTKLMSHHYLRIHFFLCMMKVEKKKITLTCTVNKGDLTILKSIQSI